MFRVIIRGFKRAGNMRAIIFQDKMDLENPDELETAMPSLCEKHCAMVIDEPHMIEFEFPDEPEADRFFRFGTDPSLMVLPIGVDLSQPMTVREVMAAADAIFVREGAQTVALSALPPEQQVLWLERWAAKGKVRT